MLHVRGWMVVILLFGMLVPSLALAATLPFNVPDVDTMLRNLEAQLPSLWRLVTGFAFLAGFFCIFNAVYELKQYGQGMSMMSAQHSLKGPFMMLIIGAALVYSPSAMQTFMVTLFGDSNILKYPILREIDPSFTLMGNVLTKIVTFVGLVAFIRGLMMFNRIGHGKSHGQESFGKAATHLIGGTLALNIVGTARIIGSTLGITW